VLRSLWKRWLVITRKVGEFQSRIILTLVYFVVMAPFALAVRWLSDPLQLRGDPSWQAYPANGGTAPSLNSAGQQF
jgi:hypothetical protein